MNFKHKYFFLFPGLFVLIGILIFPIIFVVRLSLSGWNSYNPCLDYIGLENYIERTSLSMKRCMKKVDII